MADVKYHVLASLDLPVPTSQWVKEACEEVNQALHAEIDKHAIPARDAATFRKRAEAQRDSTKEMLKITQEKLKALKQELQELAPACGMSFEDLLAQASSPPPLPHAADNAAPPPPPPPLASGQTPGMAAEPTALSMANAPAAEADAPSLDQAAIAMEAAPQSPASPPSSSSLAPPPPPLPSQFLNLEEQGLAPPPPPLPSRSLKLEEQGQHAPAAAAKDLSVSAQAWSGYRPQYGTAPPGPPVPPGLVATAAVDSRAPPPPPPQFSEWYNPPAHTAADFKKKVRPSVSSTSMQDEALQGWSTTSPLSADLSSQQQHQLHQSTVPQPDYSGTSASGSASGIVVTQSSRAKQKTKNKITR